MSIYIRENFDAIIKKIRILVENYENNQQHYNQYQFYLANGERISLEITPQSIAHLLGIRIDNLRATRLFKKQDSYGILKEFLNNSQFFYQQILEGHLHESIMFSKYLENKLISFENLIYSFNPNTIEFICKYDRSKIYQSAEEKDLSCDYIIAKKTYDGDLHLLGLVRSQGNQYNPMTNMVFAKNENQLSQLKSILTNQTLTFASSIVVKNPITNYKNTLVMTLSTKSNQIEKMKEYARNISGIAIDVSSDLQFALNGISMKTEKINSYHYVCQQLLQSMQNQTIFHMEDMEEETKKQLDEEIFSLVHAYNNTLCNKKRNQTQLTTESNLLEQYKLLSLQVENLKQQLEETRRQSIQCYEQNQQLKEQIDRYEIFQTQIFQVVDKQKQKVIVE